MRIKDINNLLHSGGDEEAHFEVADWTSTNPIYVGYVNHKGVWMIQKIDETSGTSRWARGNSGYATAWTGKASLSYDYFYNLGI